MKKVIIAVIIIAVALGAFFYFKGSKEKKAEDTVANDKETIEQVYQACKELSTSPSLSSLGDAGSWHVFELEFIHADDNNELQQKLEEKLGEDFETKLSNGDSLFVGFLPYRNSYRIWAGSPAVDSCMIYPDWGYEAVESFTLQ